MKVYWVFCALLISCIALAEKPVNIPVSEIEQAFYIDDVATLQELSDSLKGYNKALANYRIAILFSQQKERKRGKKAINQAISSLEQHLETYDQDDEAWALLSAAYGIKISLSKMSAMSVGPKADGAIARALKLNEQNPRAHLIYGIALHNKPKMFGGDKALALKAFEKAAHLFESSPEGWGFAETYVWIGLSYLALDKKEKATLYWNKALAIEANYSWPRKLIEEQALR